MRIEQTEAQGTLMRRLGKGSLGLLAAVLVVCSLALALSPTAEADSTKYSWTNGGWWGKSWQATSWDTGNPGNSMNSVEVMALSFSPTDVFGLPDPCVNNRKMRSAVQKAWNPGSWEFRSHYFNGNKCGVGTVWDDYTFQYWGSLLVDRSYACSQMGNDWVNGGGWQTGWNCTEIKR